jgi:holo-[acyl-carrier protein] synthase
MIAGIGTDIVAVARLGGLYERHGQRALAKLLSPRECTEFAAAHQPARFLAKRFAAKEAFGKALGIGLSAPATLPNIGVAHDSLGRPLFEYAAPLAEASRPAGAGCPPLDQRRERLCCGFRHHGAGMNMTR